MGFAAAGAVAGYILWQKNQNKKPLPVVDSVDLDKYMGLWYEIARLPMRYEKDCIGPKAFYSLNDDGTVKVVNSCRKDSLNGEEEVVEGKAFVADSSSRARLKVQFQWPFKGDYYILDVGKEYDYALVGDPSRKHLWLLSRKPAIDDKIKEHLLMYAGELGFNTEKLIYAKHETDEALNAVETFKE